MLDLPAAQWRSPMEIASELDERGFVVIPGPIPSDRMHRLVQAYDAGRCVGHRR